MVILAIYCERFLHDSFTWNLLYHLNVILLKLFNLFHMCAHRHVMKVHKLLITLTLGTSMAASLPKTCGTCAGVALIIWQTEMSTTTIVGSTAISPCSNSQTEIFYIYIAIHTHTHKHKYHNLYREKNQRYNEAGSILELLNWLCICICLVYF